MPSLSFSPTIASHSTFCKIYVSSFYLLHLMGDNVVKPPYFQNAPLLLLFPSGIGL
eukprot:c35999_g1_i1 orf=1-165(-)